MSGRDPQVLALEAELGTQLTMARIRPTTPPRIAARYEVEAILGSGGFGTVVRARDPKLDRQVAIKCVPTAQPERSYESLVIEAQALARLRVPEVVT